MGITSVAQINHRELERKHHIHVLGELARGFSISYGDRDYPGKVIREYPDGRRVILHTDPDGTITEGREIPPRPSMDSARIAEKLEYHSSTSYRDPDYPGKVIREYPDGHRMILRVAADGTITDGPEIPPRKDRAAPDPDADPA